MKFLRAFVSSLHQQEEQEKQLHPVTEKDHIRTAIILIWTAIGLSIIRYWGDPYFFASLLSDAGLKDAAWQLRSWVDEGPDAELHRLTWWASTIITMYLVVPLILVKTVFKIPLTSMGLRWKGALQGWPLYLVLLMIMLPLVYWFSGTSSFQQRYPFYDLRAGESLWPNFWIWEGLYFMQFFALEFFFRGFMTLGMKRSFGLLSVFVMMVPYCMIHFGKPMPETIGAILAGIALGFLSLKSRSILLGVLIHYSVAICMDLMSLWRKGWF